MAIARGYPTQVVARRIYIEALNHKFTEMREAGSHAPVPGQIDAFDDPLPSEQPASSVLPDQDVK